MEVIAIIGGIVGVIGGSLGAIYGAIGIKYTRKAHLITENEHKIILDRFERERQKEELQNCMSGIELQAFKDFEKRSTSGVPTGGSVLIAEPKTEVEKLAVARLIQQGKVIVGRKGYFYTVVPWSTLGTRVVE